MDFSTVCVTCGRGFDLDESPFRCACGGLLDLAPFEVRYSPRDLVTDASSLFRYAAALPYRPGSQPWRKVSMGEGLTPLMPLDPADPDVLVKVDYAMPTLSFKDRGAVMVVTQAKVLGAKRILQDSSGNAGASVAAYAARAGIPCDIYVPESTSPRKIAQISAYGATVRTVPGSREDTAAAALEAASQGGCFFASHVYNPLFHQGTKTYLYEIFEALGGQLPEVLGVPVGNGTLLLGLHIALRDLLRLGLVQGFPKVLAIQAEGCAPIHRAHASGASQVNPVENWGTGAEGIAIAAPMRGNQILSAIREMGAEVILAPEADILPAKTELTQKGYFVETTTAATWAAYRAWARKRPVGEARGRVVLPLCGAGLKGG